MNNEQTEVSIRLSDLCAAFLKKIKPVIVLVLVFTLLGALFGAYRAVHAGSPGVSEETLREAETALVDAKNSVSEAEGELNKLLEIDIPQAETAVERARLLVERRQNYLDNSLFFALDPLHCGVSRLTLNVETDTEINPESPWLTTDPSVSIAQAYAKLYPYDSELLENVRQIMKADADRTDLNEMITISSSDSFVSIRVFHEDAEVADEVMDYLLDALQQRLTAIFGDYSAQVINRFVSYEVNESVLSRHNEEVDKLYAAQADLFAAEQNLQMLTDNAKASAEQKVADCKAAAAEAEDQLNTLQNRYANTRPTPKNILKKAVKFSVVFFVVGLFGACCLVFLDKLLSGKLQDINDALVRFSFPLIGTLPTKKKRLFDRTIRKLEGEPDLDFESAGKATAQSLFSVIGDRRVALVSSAGAEVVREFLPFVGDRIPVCGDLLRDAEAVKAAGDYEGFVLIEKRGTSRFDLIDAEARRIRSIGKQPEGMILL